MEEVAILVYGSGKRSNYEIKEEALVITVLHLIIWLTYRTGVHRMMWVVLPHLLFILNPTQTHMYSIQTKTWRKMSCLLALIIPSFFATGVMHLSTGYSCYYVLVAFTTPLPPISYSTGSSNSKLQRSYSLLKLTTIPRLVESKRPEIRNLRPIENE